MARLHSAIAIGLAVAALASCAKSGIDPLSSPPDVAAISEAAAAGGIITVAVDPMT